MWRVSSEELAVIGHMELRTVFRFPWTVNRACLALSSGARSLPVAGFFTLLFRTFQDFGRKGLKRLEKA